MTSASKSWVVSSPCVLGVYIIFYIENDYNSWSDIAASGVAHSNLKAHHPIHDPAPHLGRGSPGGYRAPHSA